VAGIASAAGLLVVGVALLVHDHLRDRPWRPAWRG
jgi:hypothetical protein